MSEQLARRGRWLYARLPVPIQNAAFTAMGYSTKRKRYGTAFRERLSWLESSQWWDADQIATYQDEQVVAMVRHAASTVPFYEQAYHDVDWRSVTGVSDLDRLPLLPKAEVRRAGSSLVSRAYPESSTVRNLTSGTTGTPLTIWLTPEALQFQWAVWWRHRARFGLKLGDLFLTFGARLPVVGAQARPPYWRTNRSVNQVYLSTYHLTPSTMDHVAEWLMGEQFAFFTGYPSAMYVLANHMKKRGIRLAHPPRYVVSGSDALIPAFETLLHEVFEAPVTDQYGSAEACGNFARCEAGRYHLDFEFGVAELLPIPGLESSNLRRVVFTGFANPAMPFIRYEIGDYVEVADSPCPCGRHSMSVHRIEGRTEDFVRTPDGRMAIGMNQVLEWAPGVEEAQILQESVDKITVKIVPGPNYAPSDQQVLEKEFRMRLGEEIAIEYRLVEHIARTASGKFRAVVSKVEPVTEAERALRERVNDVTS